MMEQDFIEGEHFYYNDDGFIVLTEKYHLRRGNCCGNGCLHCPFNFENVPEPKRKYLLENKKKTEMNKKKFDGI